MAVRQQPTLAEMTAHILEAVGEGGEGVAAPNTVAMVQALIRRNQKSLVLECPWTINRLSAEVELPAGQTEFEVPDGMDFGGFKRIAAMRADNPQDMWDLIPGITTDDRAAWLNNPSFDAASNCPYKYQFTDGMVEVGPACTQAITIRVEYESAASPLEDDGDRPQCDGTAREMRTEIAYRNARGGDLRAGIPAVAGALAIYLKELKPRQGTKRTIQIGRKADILDPARRRGNVGQRHWAYRNVRP